jgi:molecular chaperone GrpE
VSDEHVEDEVVEEPEQDERPVPGTAAPSQAPAEQAVEDDRLLRLAADFENYKKRAAREREEYVALANARLLGELLPVVDDLERALAAAEQHEEAQLEEGVRLVHRSLASLLERHGITAIETDGKFDPHVHEALLAQPSEEAESGAVLDVIQKGYKLGDRVVRPARVIVAE